MSYELALQSFILVISMFVIFKTISKMPKKIAIGVTIFLIVFITVITLLVFYQPEFMQKILNYTES